MSNSDSFIDEVSDELRRERLFATLRRWGWVAVLAVLLLVAGAAWREWSLSREAARAQAFGDSLLAAVSSPDARSRRAGLAEITPDGAEQATVLGLLEAAAALDGADADAGAARARLLELAETPGLSRTYRDLALLKAMLAGGTGDAARDAAVLAELAAPGAPYRPLAVELQAFAALAAGDEATAVTLLRALAADAEATQTLRQRALQMIVALGAAPEPA